MPLTQQQIEGDFYALIKNSKLGTAIHGKVYRPGRRPANAVTEDIVVQFVTALDSPTSQTGVVQVYIHVPNVFDGASGNMVQDFERIGELQTLIDEFVQHQASKYCITKEPMQAPLEMDKTDQHAIVARLKFEI